MDETYEQEERAYSVDLFTTDLPVWYEKSGKVSSAWLSLCEEERNQTRGLLEKITSTDNLFKAYKRLHRNPL
jgi:hypothetical protein